MDGRTLDKLSRFVDLRTANGLIPGLYEAFDVADINNINRRRMFLAQTAEESVGWSARTEFASGEEYQGRVDLGNTHPGDGVRFKGRGFIQLTGRNNYGYFSGWCYKRGLVPNNHYFLDHPEEVANDRFAWLSAAFYWLGNHNHGYDYLNKAADAKDVYGATLMINGGTNGLETRQYYYNQCVRLGNELMTPVPPSDPNWSDVMTREQFQAFLKKEGYVKKEDLAKSITTRVRAAVFGTKNQSLHEEAPKLYVQPEHSVDGRLKAHSGRLQTVEKATSVVSSK